MTSHRLELARNVRCLSKVKKAKKAQVQRVDHATARLEKCQASQAS